MSNGHENDMKSPIFWGGEAMTLTARPGLSDRPRALIRRSRLHDESKDENPMEI